jgi:uncharacterized membrane protein
MNPVTYRIVICSLSCCTIFFALYLISGSKILGKNIIGHKTCVLIVSNIFSETFHILRRTQQDTLNINTSTYKVPVIRARF